MFYFKITKTTRAVPRMTSTRYEQCAGPANMGQRVAGILAGNLYSCLTVEAISQRDYIAATRPKD
jgi:hypothetical protein